MVKIKNIMKIFHVYYVLYIVLRSLWSKAFLVKIIEGITNQMAIMPLYKTKTSSFTVGGFKLQFSLKLIYETNSLKIIKTSVA